MALATRCPHCQAVFRVVVDQLKLRGGLVRCGDCGQVFDAIGTLIYVDDATAAAAQEVPPLTLMATPTESEASTAPSPTEEPEAPPPVDMNTLALFDEPRPAAADAAQAAATPALPAAQSDATPEQPAFLHDGEGRPRRRISIALVLGVLLAGILLVLQLIVSFRTDLLARWPGMRPALAALCVPFQCTAGWPTRADLLAVVGSELLAIPGTTALELTAVVRNRGSFRVALPAIEVTLTDTQNRIVARRVFAPADYLASAGESADAIEAGLAPGADYTIKLVFEARGIRASGFVVYPFYL
jgi:predicted Zn finger-like uncharacterized protein